MVAGMSDRIDLQVHDHVARIRLTRAAKRNAFDLAMLRQLAEAYTVADADPEVRVLLVEPEGDHFTAGLDLGEVGPAVASGAALFPEELVDPLGLRGRVRSKPVVVAVRGHCLTIGIELCLASDIIVAASDTRFGQIEILRGIFPFGGATMRMPSRFGWHNAMRWLLTGETFDANEAHRIGLVSEITAPAEVCARGAAIAASVAKAAPLGVRASLESARLSEREGEAAANALLLEQARALMSSEDAAEGLASFLERRAGVFKGR
ncbi:MAG: crotonase/enoyl-CoA hydratase family protein [Deltaproteobacteria bacterium]|nr:crotonase/enoyl-CoA hydratase family protein [Deltaproteobacteria bacterium]